LSLHVSLICARHHFRLHQHSFFRGSRVKNLVE
jgi:hypothetical protein